MSSPHAFIHVCMGVHEALAMWSPVPMVFIAGRVVHEGAPVHPMPQPSTPSCQIVFVHDVQTHTRPVPLVVLDTPGRDTAPSHLIKAFQLYTLNSPVLLKDTSDAWGQRVMDTRRLVEECFEEDCTNQSLFQSGHGQLYKNDLSRWMHGTNWAGENIVDLYAHQMIDSAIQCGSSPRFDTYVNGVVVQLHMGEAGGHPSALHANKHLKWFEAGLQDNRIRDWVTITCVGHHFRVVFVHHVSVSNVEVHFMDPFARSREAFEAHTHLLQSGIKRFLQEHGCGDVVVTVFAVTGDKVVVDSLNWKKHHNFQLSSKYTHVPQQHDTHSCGPRALMALECVLRNSSGMIAEQWDVPTYKVLVVWSILYGGLRPSTLPPLKCSIPFEVYASRSQN